MAALYNVSDLVLYKDDKDGSGIFIARIIKKRADYGGEHRYLIQTINKSGTGREWNTELKDYVNEDSLHTSGDDVFITIEGSFVGTRSKATDVREYMVNYFWDKFKYDGDNAKASKFIIKYILPSLGNWSPPGSPPAIEEHTKPHHPNTGISWGHNDDNTLYRLHIPGYALWKKPNPS